MASPAALTYSPALQSVHARQLSALLVVLKLSAAHGLQLRFWVALPAWLTYSPLAQTVCATQLVAALASWSQLASGHGTSGAEPPAQYVPVEHVSHTGSMLLVAACICTVPAAQLPCVRQLD